MELGESVKVKPSKQSFDGPEIVCLGRSIIFSYPRPFSFFQYEFFSHVFVLVKLAIVEDVSARRNVRNSFSKSFVE
jgi:hypothetical protein